MPPIDGGKDTKDTTVVLVIDALDECDRDEDMRLVIRLLTRLKTIESLKLKIFLTSRPEVHVRLGFKAIQSDYQDFILHEIAEPTIQRDLYLYLEHELSKIRQTYNHIASDQSRELATNWPTRSDVQLLAHMSTPLLIFATTACRFIDDGRFGKPDELLTHILRFRAKGDSQLDDTYLPILQRLTAGLSGARMVSLLNDFKIIIGAIIVLVIPLSPFTLAHLLSVPLDTLYRLLDRMHAASTTAPVRLFHQSFRDFLLDDTRHPKHEFWIDGKATHERMARACFRIMGDLKENIASLGGPGSSRSEIKAEDLERALPPAMQYSCLYWVQHIQAARLTIEDGDRVHEFLSCHLLHWFEALSLMSQAWGILPLIKSLQSCVNVS